MNPAGSSFTKKHEDNLVNIWFSRFAEQAM